MEGLANYLLKSAGLKQMLRLAEAVEKNPGRAAQRGIKVPASASFYNEKLLGARSGGSHTSSHIANPETVGNSNLHPTEEVREANKVYKQQHADRQNYTTMNNYEAMQARKNKLSPLDLKHVHDPLNLVDRRSPMFNESVSQISDRIQKNLSSGEGGVGLSRAYTSGKFTPKAYQQARSSARALPLPS